MRNSVNKRFNLGNGTNCTYWSIINEQFMAIKSTINESDAFTFTSHKTVAVNYLSGN